MAVPSLPTLGKVRASFDSYNDAVSKEITGDN
jgi:hypothetical protein